MTTVLVANPSADLYGSDRMMLEAVRGMRSHGWRVVVTCSVDGPLIVHLREAGAEVRVLRAPVLRKAMLTPRGVLSLVGEVSRGFFAMRRLVDEIRPDVIYVSTVTIPLWLVVARAARLPVVVHVHEAEQSLSWGARLALRLPLALARLVVFNSETSRRVSGLALLERNGRARVVHNGVPGPDRVVPARPDLSDPLRIVYVGRLSPRKGVDLVLSAAGRLVDEGVGVEVHLVGAVFPGYEWYETELRALVETLGLSTAVRFHGFQTEVWAQLAAADVAVVPSRLDESFGNTVVEALMAARPVVVSDHTGLREAAAGFSAVVRVARDDAAALAAGLLSVRHAWPEFRASAEQDAAEASSRYSRESFQGQVVDLVGGLVAQNGSAAAPA